ncbi:alpha/beta hydrolase [Solirubrobacter phytolaccae]|uniref:Alpha/beta hydrolase n=1 Tax=Solirubrobacter phytolaccae TaxID=1404360 RepID=A0A9X3NCA3_9ACTN|nr:alpha/beta hydrolase [Solirubrobacter phytolaccae]MDA0183818.1 alpha/beta hydrolase [Solirubrobacter phytolaccae]
MIDGFEYRDVRVAENVHLHTAIGGSGPALLLLHGFPQTHLMWRAVAPALAKTHTVICPDLRGYGASSQPADGYSKRTMAQDIVNLAQALGHDEFELAGHDRGALVAFRAGLDHPDRITRLTILDVLPTLDMWDVLHGANAAVAFHLYLMAQPPGLPETLIAGAPDAFFAYFLDAWGTAPFAPHIRDAYLEASRNAIPSIVADYRASATIDIEHDQHDRDNNVTLDMPVTVVQQDWGAALGYDAVALWSAWAPDLDHRTVTSGHWMAESDPQLITDVLRTSSPK